MSKPFISGVAFGAALTATAIYEPGVIIGQMTFQNWHMVLTFLTASGTSTLLVNALQRLGYIHLNPREYSTIGIFSVLDGNILGGLLLGAGLTISGSCPGTVFAQVGTGIRSGLYTLGGGILGGIIWSGFLRSALRGQAKSSTKTLDGKRYPLTLDEWTGTSRLGTIIVMEALFASAAATIAYLASPKSGGLVDPVTGGILVAGAQMVSIVTRKSLLGTSSSFEEVGDYFWWTLGQRNKPKSYSAIALTTGMIVGALAVSLALPSARVAPDITIEPTRAILGGVLLAVGSRMAGGCTSGHGISGMSLHSVSSFVTVAAMFVGGAGIAAIIE
ncbi:uncharacterized protein F4812DRAFT_458336 [Daldinia caldariorum]|uniref:uncharacterized protein n=1 Tax=Daldinia caldariorum TaxID=326644 RepID=UPI002008C240|nr:uncharacterized protein F4812DRAFT_458336 [Daldinia caldariorum]KAI1468812.1 hypothetical protein F4812DRAFT_458336 [Daldinia caldariorum]